LKSIMNRVLELDHMLEDLTSGHCQLLKLVELTGVSRVGGTIKAHAFSLIYIYIPKLTRHFPFRKDSTCDRLQDFHMTV
jgi:hypothetical protein